MTKASASTSEQATEPEDRHRGTFDMIAVFVLSITAVLTAWCGFESSKWGGEMSIAFSEASGARVKAGNFASKARDARQFDVSIYSQWVAAKAEEKAELASYVEDRFPADFATVFDAWIADGMVEPTPFARADYAPEGTADALEWNEVADQKFEEALVNNQRGDDYSLLTVLFALVLFLTAMSQRNISLLTSRMMLGLAILVSLGGVVLMLTFPIKI